MLYLDHMTIMALAVMFTAVYLTVLCMRWKCYIHFPAAAIFVAGAFALWTGKVHFFALAILCIPLVAGIMWVDEKGKLTVLGNS